MDLRGGGPYVREGGEGEGGERLLSACSFVMLIYHRVPKRLGIHRPATADASFGSRNPGGRLGTLRHTVATIGRYSQGTEFFHVKNGRGRDSLLTAWLARYRHAGLAGMVGSVARPSCCPAVVRVRVRGLEGHPRTVGCLSWRAGSPLRWLLVSHRRLHRSHMDCCQLSPSGTVAWQTVYIRLGPPARIRHMLILHWRPTTRSILWSPKMVPAWHFVPGLRALPLCWSMATSLKDIRQYELMRASLAEKP